MSRALFFVVLLRVNLRNGAGSGEMRSLFNRRSKQKDRSRDVSHAFRDYVLLFLRLRFTPEIRLQDRVVFSMVNPCNVCKNYV